MQKTDLIPPGRYLKNLSQLGMESSTVKHFQSTPKAWGALKLLWNTQNYSRDNLFAALVLRLLLAHHGTSWGLLGADWNIFVPRGDLLVTW